MKTAIVAGCALLAGLGAWAFLSRADVEPAPAPTPTPVAEVEAPDLPKPPAVTAETLVDQFGARADSITVGEPKDIVIAGTGPVTLTPVKYELPDTPGVFFRCGLFLQRGADDAQALVTVGIGQTEALSCGGLRDVETVKASDGTEMIGAIYGFRSPNAAFDGPVIVRWDEAAKTFIADDDRAMAVEEAGPVETLDALSAAMGKL